MVNKTCSARLEMAQSTQDIKTEDVEGNINDK